MSKTRDGPAHDPMRGLSDNDAGWPFETPGFTMERTYEREDKGVFCIRIPEWIFLRMATGFYDVDLSCERSLAMLSLIELWLFTLYVCMTRVCKNIYKPSDFAFTVFLETLLDSERNPTNNYRLWIFEHDSSAQYSLARIFMDAVQSDKRIDGTGSFIDHSQPERQVARRDGTAHTGTFGGETTDAGGADTSSRKSEYSDHYKRVSNTPALSGALDVYLNQSRFSNNAKAFVAPEMMAPETHFSVRNAFRLASENDMDNENETRLNILPAQLDIRNYRVRRGGKVFIKLQFIQHTFKLIPQVFLTGPGYFVTRMFPWRQMNPKHVVWNRFLLAMMKQSNTRNNEAPLRKHTRTEDSDDDDDDDDDDDEDEDDPLNPLIKKAPPRLLPNTEDPEHAARMKSIDEVYPSMHDDTNNFMDAPMRMTDQQVRDMTQLYKYITDEKKANGGLSDFCADMSVYYRQQKQILKNQFQDDQPEMDRALLNLRKIMFEKFDTTCTTATGDVSDSQRIHNANFTQKNLANRHWKLPIIDPKLPVIANAFIWMMEGFTWKNNVATSQFLCVFSYIGIGDRWRREFNLHINFIYTGGNGIGKSVIIEVVQKNILEATTKNINGKSDKADAVNGVSTDVVICSDDANLATYFSAVGKDCDAKSHLTTMKTTRAILDLVQEISPNGSKKTIRKQTQLVFTQIRSLMLGTNESLADVENNSNGFLQSAKALYNRFLAIEVPCYDNEIHNVPGSIAAQSAKTWEMRETEEQFHDLNIKFDCLRGWAHKLMSIDQDIFHIEMKVFDLVWNSLTNHLAKNGIMSDHPRVAIQAKLWCQQLVLFDAYLQAHCLPTSPHYGKTITALSLMDWVPVCMEHHVFITMSAFYRFFVPPSMDPVLDVLTALMEDSFKNQDKRAVFAEKQKRIFEMDKQKREEQNQERLINMSRKSMGNRRQRDFHQEEEEIEHSDYLNTPGGALNMRLQRMTVQEQVEAAAAEAARRAHVNIEEDTNDGINNNGQTDRESDQQPNKPPPIDSTYVTFNYTLEGFASYAQVRMKATRFPMQPGHSAIVSALKRLGNTAVKSSRYVLDSLDQTTPTLDDKSPSVIYQALVKPDRYDRFQVHYGVLVKNGQFRSALANAINAYCHKNVIERKILLATENPRYPFVLNTMDIKPGPHVLTISNPSYVMQTTMAGYRGRASRVRSLHQSEQPMSWAFEDYDMDTVGLLAYFRSRLGSKVMGPDDVYIHHPTTIARELVTYREKKMFETGRGASLDYPSDWLKEYAAVEYSKRTMDQTDLRDEMLMQPAERMEEQRLRKETEEYMKLHGIVQKASYISSILDVNAFDDSGQTIGGVLQLKFTDALRNASYVRNSKVYELTHANPHELAKAAQAAAALDGDTSKEYLKSTRRGKQAIMRKEKKYEYDFEELARKYPSAKEQHQQQQAAQRALRDAEDAFLDRVREQTDIDNADRDRRAIRAEKKRRANNGQDPAEEEDDDEDYDDDDDGELDGLGRSLAMFEVLDSADPAFQNVDDEIARFREETN